MKLRALFAFFLAACIASGAEANVFDVTVSANYADANVQIAARQAPMDTVWFTQRTGGRTVWSDNANIGQMTHGIRGNVIAAHATFVIRTTQAGNGTYTVNMNAGKVHITSWYPHADQDTSQQCHVYEDGTCNCAGPDWDICGADPASTAIRQGFIAAARASRIVATHELQTQGVIVTNNP